MNEPLTLAQVVGVYGIKGWVKLRIWLEQPELLATLGTLALVPERKERRSLDRLTDVLSIKPQGKGYVAQLKGIEDRNGAEALKGWYLQAPEAQLPRVEEGEFYWRDLVGLEVWCYDVDSPLGTAPIVLGRIDYMLDTGANDVMVVAASGQSIDDRERLIPWLIDEVVTKVDLSQRRVEVRWYIDV